MTLVAYNRRDGDCFAYRHARLRGEALIKLDSDCLAPDLPGVLHPFAARFARSAPL